MSNNVYDVIQEDTTLKRYVEEIEAYISVPVFPRTRRVVFHDFNDDIIRITPFLLQELVSVTVDNESFSDFLEIDYDAGLIYLKHLLHAKIVKVEYKYGLSNEEVEHVIIPVARELQRLNSEGKDVRVSSYTKHEGNVSLAESSSESYLNFVFNKLNVLKNRYNVRVDLL